MFHSELSEYSEESTSSKQLSDSTVASVSNKRRWLSNCVLMFTTLSITSTYSIIWTSLFPYLLKLTNGAASTVLFGWVVAGYSLCRLIMSPILGFWSDRRPTREPLIVCFIASLIANIAYIYASALPSGGQYMVLVARIVLGGCAGGIAVIRSYVAASTTEENRSCGLAGLSGFQTVGFLGGPVLALVFVPLGGKGVSVPAIRLHFNMYTGPAYLSGLLDIVNIVLLVVLFREYKIERKTTKDSDKKSMRERVDWLAVVVALVILFVVYSTIAILETIASPYSMDEFAWTRQQAIFYNGIIIACSTAIAVVVYVISAIASKWVELRVLFMVGLIILAISFFAFIPISDQLPKLRGSIHGNSNTTVAIGCRYPELKWCKDIPQLFLPQYIAAAVIFNIGYSASLLPGFTLYSKLFGPYPQGTMMGILTAVGSLSRGVTPLYISFMYDHTGPQITFASVVGIISLAIIILMVFCYRMVPYGRKHVL